MQGYIEVMAEKLGINPTKGKRVNPPMSDDITNMTPCLKDEAQLLMSATGMHMVAWLATLGTST